MSFYTFYIIHFIFIACFCSMEVFSVHYNHITIAYFEYIQPKHLKVINCKILSVIVHSVRNIKTHLNYETLNDAIDLLMENYHDTFHWLWIECKQIPVLDGMKLFFLTTFKNGIILFLFLILFVYWNWKIVA